MPHSPKWPSLPSGYVAELASAKLKSRHVLGLYQRAFQQKSLNPNERTHETTKRPVCPYAPNTVTVRFGIIKDFLAADVGIIEMTTVLTVGCGFAGLNA